MNDYDRINLAGMIARKSLDKEAGIRFLSGALKVRTTESVRKKQKKRRRHTRQRTWQTRPYFDLETGRFL